MDRSYNDSTSHTGQSPDAPGQLALGLALLRYALQQLEHLEHMLDRYGMDYLAHMNPVMYDPDQCLTPVTLLNGDLSAWMCSN